MQVHDVSPEEGEGSNFELLDAIEYWEVPIEGGPPPDNPVPAGDGSLYSAPAAGAAGAPAHSEAVPAAAAPADLFTENGGSFPAENGHTGPVRPFTGVLAAQRVLPSVEQRTNTRSSTTFANTVLHTRILLTAGQETSGHLPQIFDAFP